MSRSHLLDLPYLLPSQADKHVTFNEAIAALDLLVQLSVLSSSATAPPTNPTEGDRYIVPPDATGGWSEAEGSICAFQDGGWRLFAPQEGWQAWVQDVGAMVRFQSGAWEPVSVVETVNPVALVGVNTLADMTNRLAVKSDAVLLSHTADGTGGVQLKLNKSETDKTASILFQTNWSGRAEIGLSGDDGLQLKVSPDGTAFQTALVARPETGAVELPGGLIDTASGQRSLTLVPALVKDIWRSDMDALPTPRIYTIASVAANAITIMTNEVEQFFNAGMRDATMVRIWNVSKSPAEPAWINWNAASNVFLVHDANDVDGWNPGEQLRLGDPNPTGTNALQMVALDISNYLFNTYGQVFRQRGLKVAASIGGVGGRSTIDCSGNGAVGSAFGVASGSDGNRQGCFLDIFTQTLPPISNSNLLFVRESISGTATGVMALRSLRLAGIWV